MKGAEFEFIASHLEEYGVSGMCRALGVTRQSHCAWASRPPSAHEKRDLEPAGPIGAECDASRGIYGAPKVFMALKAKGVRASRKRVARIMSEHGWRGATRGRVRKPSGEKRAGGNESADDPVKRNLTAKGPNRARFADITCVRTHQGWPCPAVVMDAWPGMIVGWSMGPRITAELAGDALRMAIARRHPARGCIHHGDHGAQHTSLLLGRIMGGGIRHQAVNGVHIVTV